MESFFDQYRNKAENKTDLPYEVADWQKMEKKLNDQGNPPALVPLLTWFILAGAILFASLVFFNKTNRSSTPDETLIPAIVGTIHDTVYHRDTVYIDKPIYIVRTEKIVKPDRQETIRLLNELTAANQDLRHSLQQNQVNLHHAMEKIKVFSDSLVVIESGKNQMADKSSASMPPKHPQAIGINPAPEDLEVPIAVSLPLAADTLTVWQKFLHSFKPARLDIGGIVGVPLILNPEIRNKPGYMIGARLIMALQSRFELQAGFTYTKLFYEGSKMDLRLGIPVQQAPLNDLLFSKAEVQRPGYYLDLGLYYSFINHKRIVPKIGIGMGLMLPQISEVSYDFIAPSSPVEWSLDSNFKPGATNPYSFQLHAAMNYRINPRWSWVLQGTLHQKLKSEDFLSQRMDLNTGLLYRLF